VVALALVPLVVGQAALVEVLVRVLQALLTRAGVEVLKRTPHQQ
jgi:hypothetical protein